jgi:6,7-dimethyl-8-ribityllumazine synthase
MRKKICIIAANYYPEITKNLLKGAVFILKNNGIKNHKEILVPGVFEIPVIISRKINKFDAFIVIGCVIKGKTNHFDLICKSTTESIMNLSVNNKKPIGNGIISCFNKRQATERSGMNKKNKGKEAAKAILSVLKI